MLLAYAGRTCHKAIASSSLRVASLRYASTNQKATERNAINAEPSSSTQPPYDQPFPAPYHHKTPTLPYAQTAVTRWLDTRPKWRYYFLKFGDFTGYGSPKMIAYWRTRRIYPLVAAVPTGPEKDFWYDTLALPSSFQSWFMIANLHVWLLTVRFRALPPKFGKHFIQALIAHFFNDVEDRLRAILGKRAPERLVTKSMMDVREQWRGLGISCDLALMTGDKDMASMIWRNFLGARGAQGIAYPDPDVLYGKVPSPDTSAKTLDPTTAGIVDFEGAAVDQYVRYPELMLLLTCYIRRELTRLGNITDTAILGGEGSGMVELVMGPQSDKVDKNEALKPLEESMTFGTVREAGRKMGIDIKSFRLPQNISTLG